MAAAKRKKTELALVGDGGILKPYEATEGRFTSGPTRHHRQFFEDYRVAKMHIMQGLGDLSGFELLGDNVLCAVFCRPMFTPGKIIIPETSGEAREDWYQNKAVLIVKIGPSAFTGDESYLAARFGECDPPRVGDWMMANANAGMQCSIMGEGGTRPEGIAPDGKNVTLYSGDGWPCRLIKDTDFFMRIQAPHGVV